MMLWHQKSIQVVVSRRKLGEVSFMAGRKKKTTHSSGMYRKRITLGHDENGKPIVKAVYGKTKDELEDKIAQLRIDRNTGIIITNGKSTWKYWAESWKKLTKPSVSIGAWMNYETALKHLSIFNEEKISKITSIDIEALLSAQLESGYSKRTLSLLLNISSRIFRLARKNHAIMFDPAEDAKVPQGAKVVKREAVSQEVQDKLWRLRPLPTHSDSEKVRNDKMMLMRMFALMQLKCGLRREEAAPLEWKDTDLKNGIVTVRQAYDYKAKRLKEPKSKAGYRSIPIPDDYLQELKDWKNANDKTFAGRKWVFAYRESIMTESEFNNLWHILLDGINGISLSDRIVDGIKCSKKRKSNEIPVKKGRRHKMFYNIKFTSHQLRHTYSTNCIADGIDVRTVQYLMGHATPQMTMDYTHLSETALSDARAKMDAANLKMGEKQA